MVVPAVLLVASLAGALASLAIWGPVLNAPLYLALISMAGALLLLIAARARIRPAWIVIDGSNVLHWEDERPALATVGYVVDALKGEGFVPVVWFDANVGYLVGNRYMGPAPLARALGLPARQVFVAPKGTPADPLLLMHAARNGARVVTNDRYRDWAAAHPKVREPGFLVSGSMRDGTLRLMLGQGR